MAELNLKQITDKLNSEFSGDARKLVFWYDADAEFMADIDMMTLANAKILKLAPDNQFYTKYFLEREDPTTNYLLYAPFPKPALRENHLADMNRYSKEFFADRASLVAFDLGIKEEFKPVLQQYIKFFGAKDRTQKFYDLEIEAYDKRVIETALMSVICKTKNVSFEEIVRTVLTDGELAENKYLAEFEKYDLMVPFWRMCEETFGYTDVAPSLAKLTYTLFVTYTAKVVAAELPQAWQNYCSYKSGNIIAFLDSLMNSSIFAASFDELADLVYSTLDGEAVLAQLDIGDLAELELFKQADVFLLKWLIARLEHEDIDAKLSGYAIPDLCRARRKMHFGGVYYSHYYILENAYHVIKAAHFMPQKTAGEIWQSYLKDDFVVDQKYRYFYYHFDQVIDNAPYENLRDLVENIYTNRFLNPLAVAWNRAFLADPDAVKTVKQTDFYNKFIRPVKERVIVIISDAFRYEVGQTLLKRLKEDEKCTSAMQAMQSVMPSYTRFGMSALLPHKSLAMSDDYQVLVDGKVCDNLKAREQILQQYVPNSRAIQFDDLKTMKVSELKAITTGQEVIYVYHNQIDARGDKLNTENEVFTACEEAVIEIHTMIKRLTSANNIHFIITADHGFIYKRDKLEESDKISDFAKANALVGRRYVIAAEGITAEGIGQVALSDILGNDDQRIISVPIGSDVLKIAGGGQNFVHGGSSLQEIMLPVLDVKTSKYHTETKAASIGLISSLQKITNLTVNLEFIQNEAVTDLNKETTYKIFFISDDHEKISNDNLYVADKKDKDASNRIFRLKFTFKNKKYDKQRKYYLVAYDEVNGLEIIRQEVQMDLAFADDFGFNL